MSYKTCRQVLNKYYIASLNTSCLTMEYIFIFVKAIYTMLVTDITRRLHRRSLRLPTRRKWAQSGYLCTTPSKAQAGADAGISWP